MSDAPNLNQSARARASRLSATTTPRGRSREVSGGGGGPRFARYVGRVLVDGAESEIVIRVQPMKWEGNGVVDDGDEIEALVWPNMRASTNFAALANASPALILRIEMIQGAWFASPVLRLLAAEKRSDLQKRTC